MDQQRRSRFLLGVLMILAGGWLLAVRFYPPLGEWLDFEFLWPAYLIAAGVLLFILELLSGASGMAVPATLITGIGFILYWQVLHDDWTSWSYLWTLIPGFVGLGVVIEGLLGGWWRKGLARGVNLMLISLGLFVLFAYILGAGKGFQTYWPVLLILFGLWLSLRSFRSPGNGASD